MGKRRSEDGVSCQTCQHWEDQTSSEDEVVWGFCRRYPPTVIATHDDEVGVQCVQVWTEMPYTCGEHRPRLQ